MGPHPAVAAIRLAVRRVLHDILNDHHASADRRVSGEQGPHERPSSPLVLVACSGGADSMGLASALAFEARKLAIRAGGVTVDHGLQPGSDLRAEEVVLRLRELGLDPVDSTAVTVGPEGGPAASGLGAPHAARGPPPGRPPPPPARPRPNATAPPPSCSATPATTRPKPSCSASPAAPAPARCPAWPLFPGARGPPAVIAGPSSNSTGRSPARPAWSSPCPSGTTRTTPTPPTRAPGCATKACPPWRRRSAKESSRPSPVRPSSPATTPTPSTPGPARPRPPYATPPASWSAPSSTPCRPPCAAASCARRPSRRAPRPVRSSPGTSRRSTG